MELLKETSHIANLILLYANMLLFGLNAHEGADLAEREDKTAIKAILDIETREESFYNDFIRCSLFPMSDFVLNKGVSQ